MSGFSGNSWTRASETITHVLPCPAAQQAAQWHAHGVMWRGALPAAPFCGALPACAGACVAGRQPLHVGACPRKLAGQANFALHTAHTRRCIVLRGASLSESFCSFEKLSNLASSADRRWSMLTSSSIMPFKLLGAMLVRSAAVELGSGTLSHQNGARPS